MNDRIIIETLKPILTNCQLRELNANEEEHLQKLISRFNSLIDYSQVVLYDAVEVKKNQNTSFLALLSLTFQYKGIRSPHVESSISEYEIIGLAKLKKDYGLVLIRPETTVDKISDLFVHTDIDFDFDKEFSRRYYLAANDETKLRANISAGFLETVKNYSGLEIEIDGNVLTARLRKPFSQENVKTITNFITEINNGRH